MSLHDLDRAEYDYQSTGIQKPEGSAETDPTVAELIVGMVNITCPACTETIPTNVRLKSLETVNGSFIRVKYQDESPTHRCVGRRS